MDIALYVRVLWRFRLLMAAGIALGVLVALLAVYRISLDGGRPTLTPRANDVWISASTLFVTQGGFPWGRANLDELKRAEGGSPDNLVPRFGDAGRYSGLAILYAELAKGDDVRRAVMTGVPANVWYEPAPVQSADGQTVLPMIYMKGYGPSPEAAETIANRAADGFRIYLAEEQARNQITKDNRVEVSVVRRAIPAEVYDARSLVRPIFMFLLIVFFFVAAAFVLENLRPAAQQPLSDVVPVDEATADRPRRARRSA